METIQKERTDVTNWCRRITAVIINAACKVFRRATRPKGDRVSEYVARPHSNEEDMCDIG